MPRRRRKSLTNEGQVLYQRSRQRKVIGLWVGALALYFVAWFIAGALPHMNLTLQSKPLPVYTLIPASYTSDTDTTN